MTMEAVLKKLEARIEEFVEAHAAASRRVAELEAQVAKLEAQLAAGTELADKLQLLEAERDQLGVRLEKVLAAIDGALGGAADSPS